MLHAAATATPSPLPAPEQHSIGMTIFLHLAPAVPIVLLMFLLAPVATAVGLPLTTGIYLGGVTGIGLFELGALYYLGRKRNGRWSLDGIVLYRERLPLAQTILWGLVVYLWAGVALTLLKPVLDTPLVEYFRWMPKVFMPETALAMTAGGKAAALAAVGLELVFIDLLAPIMEEMYFRGYLLPRMAWMGRWAPLVNAALFGLYHFWSPWAVISRLIAVAPLAYVGRWKRSIYVTCVAHCALNVTSGLMLLAYILG